MAKAKRISGKQFNKLLARSRKPRNKPRRSKPTRVNRKKRGSSKLNMYSRMIADPCSSPLVPGLFGSVEGIMSRHRVSNSSTDANGYIAWCPNFHTSAGTTAGSHHNFFLFANGSTSLNPTNTLAAPMGSGSATAGYWLADPSYNFINSTTCADARLIAACVNFIYTGTVSNCSGEIAYMPNCSTASLLSGGASSAVMSIDDVFASAPYVNRIQLDGMEFVHHPGSIKPAFQSTSGGALYYQGAAVGATQVSSIAEGAGQPGWSILAWRGGGSNYRLEYTKTIEWRPEANIGIIQQTPTAVNPEFTYTEAVRSLDSAQPGWWHRAMDSVASTGGRMAGNAARSAMQSMLFAGGGARVIRPHRYQITQGDF